MEHELAISCQKISISWKPIFKNWKCSVRDDTIPWVIWWGEFGTPLEKFGAH